MSRLFPDHLRIGLGASYAALAKVRGNKVLAWRMQRFTSITAETSWQGPVSRLGIWLAELAPRNARVVVMLSAELAPLHLLPWREDIVRAEQQTLLAQNHFRRIYGETAEHWKIVVHPTAYGAGWLASGVDEALLQALTQQMQPYNATLHAVMPLSVSVFNSLRRLPGLRRRMNKTDCWVLVAEPEKLLALHLRQGRWQLLHTLPTASLQREPIRQTVLRETRLAGLADTPTELFLLGEEPAEAGDVVALDSGWRPAVDIADHQALHLLGAAA